MLIARSGARSPADDSLRCDSSLDNAQAISRSLEPCTPREVSTIEAITVATDTKAQEQILLHRRIWEKKPILRRVYESEFFGRMAQQRKPGGLSIEVGAGPGFLKRFVNDVFSTDLVSCPWLDVVADAQRLPFRSSSLSNVFGLDMLHHLAAPVKFLRETSRVLVPRGRLILVEPWITPFSWFIFRFLHQERCDLSETPWLPSTGNADKLAFDGNQAVPYLLFGPRNRSTTLQSLPQLKLVTLEQFCLFTYLFSGGFNHVSLLPPSLYPAVSKFERATLPLWRRVGALRVLLVLEKTE